MTIIIMQLTQMLVDLIIRGYTLKKLYGCSIHLFGSIFTSVTHLLVVLNKINDTRATNLKNREPRASELQEVVIIIKPTIFMPVRREQNSGNLEEHELQEFKKRKVVNFRPLPPLRSSLPVVTKPINPRSTLPKRPEIQLFTI